MAEVFELLGGELCQVFAAAAVLGGIGGAAGLQLLLLGKAEVLEVSLHGLQTAKVVKTVGEK